MQELQLTKPVRAHGETVSVLEFEEPTGKDVRELGFPYKMDSEQSILLNSGVIAKYISRLAKVPPGTVDEMSPVDLNNASWLVAGFFLQG